MTPEQSPFRVPGLQPCGEEGAHAGLGQTGRGPGRDLPRPEVRPGARSLLAAWPPTRESEAGQMFTTRSIYCFLFRAHFAAGGRAWEGARTHGERASLV